MSEGGPVWAGVLLSLLFSAAPALGGSSTTRLDAWSRPRHLRAVAEPPTRWADLGRERRRVRLWWDEACYLEALGPLSDPSAWRAWSGEHCALATVQRRRGSRWVTVARDASAGWTSAPAPDGTAFRVRLRSGNWTGRISEPVVAPTLSSPSDLARVGAPTGALLGARIGQVGADISTGSVWASTLGGGAALLSTDGLRARSLTRWEGLPDDRVVAIDQQGEWTLAGTGSGAALLRGDHVVAVFDQVLPDPWAQAVLLDSGVLWVGTTRGLTRITAHESTTPLAPWSVFSLELAAGGGVWVGYNGIARLDAEGGALPPPLPLPLSLPLSGPAEAESPGGDRAGLVGTDGVQPLTRLPGQHIYDLFETADSVLTASQETGLRTLPLAPLGAPAEPDGREHAYGVALTREGLWVARGPGRLQTPRGTRLGRAQGLPSDTVWSVADAGAGVWVGTAQGLARVLLAGSGPGPARVATLPLAPWPADSPATALLRQHGGLWLAGAGGLAHAGRTYKAAADLVVAARQPVVALLDDQRGGAWAVGQAAVHLDRRGRLSLVELPSPARDAVVHQGALWVASSTGLWRQAEVGQGMAFVSALTGVRRLVSGPRALWVVADRHVVRVLAGSGRPFLQTHPVLDIAPNLSLDPTAEPALQGALWVGTENGLERLITRGGHEGEVIDVLGDADAGVAVPAVASDGRGGCWMAAADGTVAHVGRNGQRAWLRLLEQDPPWPVAVVVDPQGRGDIAWVLTEHGTWRVRLVLPGSRHARGPRERRGGVTAVERPG